MPEHTVDATSLPAPHGMPRGMHRGLLSSQNRWLTGAMITALVAIFALCLAFAPRPTGDAEENFGGTDSKVTDVLAERGVKPWFTPVFEPGSGEVESGLFALQAALGAGLFGFALGNLRGRQNERRQQGIAHEQRRASLPGRTAADAPERG